MFVVIRQRSEKEISVVGLFYNKKRAENWAQSAFRGEGCTILPVQMVDSKAK